MEGEEEDREKKGEEKEWRGEGVDEGCVLEICLIPMTGHIIPDLLMLLPTVWKKKRINVM